MMEENIDVVACLRHCHQEMSCENCQLKNHKELCDSLEKLAADNIEQLQNAYDLMEQLAIHLADRNAFPCDYCANDADCPHRHACPQSGYYCFSPDISKI